MFLGLNPQIAVITNVEHDHPDIYPTSESFFQAFRDFVGRLVSDGVLIFCADDEGAVQIAADVQDERKTLSYGIGSIQAYSAQNLRLNERGGFTFDLYKFGNAEPEATGIALQVPGEHNVQNALAALAVADQLDLSLPKAAQALAKFQGSGRRFEVRGEFGGVTVIDDYAHHPTEIQVTLKAAREKYPQQRIWAVWQPHTFSRTQTLFARFTSAFGDADKVIITKIFPAREPIPTDFSSQDIVDAMDHPEVLFIPKLEDVTEFLSENLSPGDVLLTLTAGDAIQINDQIVERFGQNDEEK